VVSDLGAASVSIYGIVVAVVIGATSLYRELELKTIFPILARPIARSEYLVGKYFGALGTIAVFVVANTGVLLLALSFSASEAIGWPIGVFFGSAVIAGIVAFRSQRFRTYVPIPWAIAIAIAGWALCSGAPDDRRVLLGSAALTLQEVGIIIAFTSVFASFSSPFLTAIFTFGLFCVGRSADTLARLPERFFGHLIHTIAVGLSKVVPNLMVYVPPRSLLTGEASGTPLGEYLVLAGLQSVAWCVGLLAFASFVFKRRDFL
jgi:hypothetical protein